MKIQPIDSPTGDDPIRFEPVKPPAAKWRFRRLFEWQFPSVLKVSTTQQQLEKSTPAVEEQFHSREGSVEFEPSSVCLAKMVQNFIEDSNEKPPAPVRCGRRRCNCFNGNCDDDSDDEDDGFHGFGDSNFLSSGEASEILKSLVPCASAAERSLFADSSKIIEKNKICKRKDDCRKIVTDGLIALGYDASICKSRWEKSPSYPAGEYEYIDVITEKERLLIDVDFKSEFEIARSTKNYKAVLQILPQIFVGKPDRLQRIVSVATEAAKQSLKKKGMHVAPWRKPDYVKAKWLSPYTRTSATTPLVSSEAGAKPENSEKLASLKVSSIGAVQCVPAAEEGDGVFSLSREEAEEEEEEEENGVAAVKEWKPPAVKPKNSPAGVKLVAGLASVMGEKKQP